VGISSGSGPAPRNYRSAGCDIRHGRRGSSGGPLGLSSLTGSRREQHRHMRGQATSRRTAARTARYVGLTKQGGRKGTSSAFLKQVARRSGNERKPKTRSKATYVRILLGVSVLGVHRTGHLERRLRRNGYQTARFFAWVRGSRSANTTFATRRQRHDRRSDGYATTPASPSPRSSWRLRRSKRVSDSRKPRIITTVVLHAPRDGVTRVPFVRAK